MSQEMYDFGVIRFEPFDLEGAFLVDCVYDDDPANAYPDFFVQPADLGMVSGFPVPYYVVPDSEYPVAQFVSLDAAWDAADWLNDHCLKGRRDG